MNTFYYEKNAIIDIVFHMEEEYHMLLVLQQQLLLGPAFN